MKCIKNFNYWVAVLLDHIYLKNYLIHIKVLILYLIKLLMLQTRYILKNYLKKPVNL